MLQIVNLTPFSAALSVFPDATGVETAYAAVKATFVLGGDAPAPVQLPLLPADVFWADPTSSSLRAAGELGLLKTATDVLLTGRAIAPAEDTRVADVELAVGALRRRVRVFGERQWRKQGGRWVGSDPEPWSRMPLRWELAFGGTAPEAGADGLVDYEPRNPVGRGFVPADAQPVQGQPLPNLEDPAAPLESPEQRPTPACFAPVAPTWMPRRRYVGTYDEAWTRERAPYLPFDFDARYFQVAPPELVVPGFLQGGEPVQLSGFSVGAPLAFALPRADVQIEFDFDGRSVTRAAQLETVLFEPDAGRVQMLWRAALPVDKKLLRLTQAAVHSARYEQRAQSAPAASLQPA
ncbi:MAG: DUF2169 domain-containing protein [Burkholderiales bacterium]|nr:DUF2169 domain-containing protein [Burkholderiales bacterium]